MQTQISFPELAMLAVTRGLAGIGLGLLIADQLPVEQRRAIGWTLLGLGAASTVPLAIDVFAGRRARSQKTESAMAH